MIYDCVVIVSAGGEMLRDLGAYDCVVIFSVRGEMLRNLRLCGNSFHKRGYAT